MNLTPNIQHYGQFTLPQKLLKKTKKTCLFVFLGQCVHPVGVWQCELAFRCFGKQTKTKNHIYIYIYIYIQYIFFNVYANNIKFLNKVLSLFLQYSSVHVPE